MFDDLIPEKIILKGNNPDQSRKRSVYFLLLVTGRQIASTANSDIKKQINGVLNILEVDEDQDNWILKSNANGQVIVEVPKSNFRFYQISRDEPLRPGVDNQVQAKKIWIENILLGKEIPKEDRNLKAIIFRNFRESSAKLMMSIPFPLIILTILFLVKGEYFSLSHLNLFILSLILFSSLELLNMGRVSVLISRFGFTIICATLVYLVLQNNISNGDYAQSESLLSIFPLSSLLAAIQANSIYKLFYFRTLSISIVCQFLFSTLLIVQVFNINPGGLGSNLWVGLTCGYIYTLGFLWLMRIDGYRNVKRVVSTTVLKLSMILLPLFFAIVTPIVIIEEFNIYKYVLSMIAMFASLNSFIFYAHRDMPIRFLAASLIPILGQVVFI